jgi:hypothetical protein
MINARKVSKLLARTTEGRIHRILVNMRSNKRPHKKGRPQNWKAIRRFRWNEV